MNKFLYRRSKESVRIQIQVFLKGLYALFPMAHCTTQEYRKYYTPFSLFPLWLSWQSLPNRLCELIWEQRNLLFFFLVWKTEVKQGDWHKPSTGLLPRWQLLLRVMCGCRGPSSWAIFHCFLRSEVPKFKWMSVWDTGAVSGSVIHCMSPFSLCTNKIKSSKPNLRGMLNYLCSHSKF